MACVCRHRTDIKYINMHIYIYTNEQTNRQSIKERKKRKDSEIVGENHVQ